MTSSRTSSRRCPCMFEGLIDWANSFYDRYASLLQGRHGAPVGLTRAQVARRLGVICRETVGQWRGAVWHGHCERLRRFGFCARGGVLDAYGIGPRSIARSIDWCLITIKKEADMLRIAFTRIMGGLYSVPRGAAVFHH